MTDIGRLNTDREIWREREGDFYADSIFVTQDGGIGINRGGHVVVQPLSKWFAAVSEIETLRAALKPFAELADQYESAHKTRTRHETDEGHKPSPPLSDSHRVSISLGDCRRVLAAYDQGKVTNG